MFFDLEKQMKYLITIIILFTAFTLKAQQYRLNYDNSSIPELYNKVNVFLEEKSGNDYQPYRGKYKISTDEGSLKGLELSFNPITVQKNQGKVNFRVNIKGEELPVTLTLPVLTDIRYNLYTDSIKPVLNYYVNVEGVFSNGRIFPLSPDQVEISSNVGSMHGMEWILPKERNFESVVFTTKSKQNPAISKSITLYLKKYRDPRDAEGYEERNRFVPKERR
jgi:hypothetical protein